MSNSLEVMGSREIGNLSVGDFMAHSFALMAHCKPHRELLVTIRNVTNKMVVATYTLRNLETLSLTVHNYQTLKIVERNIP